MRKYRKTNTKPYPLIKIKLYVESMYVEFTQCILYFVRNVSLPPFTIDAGDVRSVSFS